MSVIAAKKRLITGQQVDFRYISSISSGGSSVAIPANQTGDLLLAVVGSTGGANPSVTQAGWTVIARSTVSVDSVREATLAYKFAKAGGETGSVSWAGSGSSIFSVGVHIFRGASGVGAIATRNSGNDILNIGYLPALTLQEPGKSLVFGCNYGVPMTANPSEMFRLTGNYAALTTVPPPGNFPETSYTKSGNYDITISAEILSQ